MKKIGILFGQENTFPQAFIERVNQKAGKGFMAEAVSIEMVEQGKSTDYAVIIDRISQDVPFYRAYLKNAAIGGTAVLNNPFWWSADEKFFNNALALHVGVAVPKTVILPSHERPADTDHNSFRNLKFPMNWDAIFNYVGFPAYMKPHSGGGWKSVYKLENANELFARHAETGQLVMMLQEEIQFNEYFRCYCLGGSDVRIMQYEPRNPHHLRYVHNAPPVAKALLEKVRSGVVKLNQALGYDFNTVEFAIRDGVPYAIDFCNPAPDADVHSVGQENFDWVVEHAADMAIARAKAHKDGKMNLTWGTFVGNQFGKTAATKAPKAAKVTVAKAPKAPKVSVAKAPRAAKVVAPKAPRVPKVASAKAPRATKVAAAKAPRAAKVAAPKVTLAKTNAAKIKAPKAPKVVKPRVAKTAVKKVLATKATGEVKKATAKVAAPKVKTAAAPKTVAPKPPKAAKTAAAPKAAKALAPKVAKAAKPAKAEAPAKPKPAVKVAPKPATKPKPATRPKVSITVKASPTAAPTVTKAPRKTAAPKAEKPAPKPTAEKVEVKKALPKVAKKK